MDIVKPLQDAFGTFLSYVPRLAGALLVLVIGVIIAKIAGSLVGRVLARTGFDRLMASTGAASFLQRVNSDLTPSKLFGKVTFWFVFVIAFTMFTSALGVPQITGFLNQLLGYIPSIFAAIAILFLATVLATFVSSLIRGATDNHTLAQIGRYSIIVYAAFAALTQLGIAVQLTGNTLLIALGGLSLAAAIAFGWGGRDLARDILNRAFTRQDNATETGAATETTEPEHAAGSVTNAGTSL